MAFSSYCRRLVNESSSLITSRIVSSQIRSKHSVSRAKNSQVISSERPLRQFVTSKGKSAGRNSAGRITIFHRGGGAKRLQRTIDLKRNSSSVGVVERIEYDPNRTSRIAVVRWVETADIGGQNKTNKLEEFDPPCKIFDPNTNTINGQFSFSSMPGMMDQKKVVCAAPTLDHVVVPGSKNPVTHGSKSPFTKMATPKDVFLSAFSSSKKDNARYSFVRSLGLPRIAIAGAKPSFFVAKMKDDLSPNEVKKWDKDSDAWAHKIKRKAAISWQSLRRQEILGLAGLADHNVSKLKLKEIDEKKKKDGKFKLDRAPVTYVLATHQMTPGKMVMNCDSSNRSNKELMRGY